MATLIDHNPDPQNLYANLIKGQQFALIPWLELESGETLTSCPVAYKTWGSLNRTRDNVLVICHALTGSSDIGDWWSPLIGPGRAFDPRHWFIFCGNVLGSPYGSASPLTSSSSSGEEEQDAPIYASTFPQTTVRDDVRAHKLVLDTLGVASVAAVIGGSMGGMTTLEWPLCTPPGFVRSIVPMATAADHSAWGISWAEAQRQCIYADPRFDDGFYDPSPEGQPAAGLAAARMIAMLTYRSCMSFDSRFGRKPPRQPQQQQNPKVATKLEADGPPLDLPRIDTAATPDGTKSERPRRPLRNPAFSAQGYLHYQGDKFVRRFDANCYLHLTNKMDSHDVTRGREWMAPGETGDGLLRAVLSRVPAGALVVSVESDALFLPEQQERLAASLPGASLAVLRSSDGHDGFLLEFEQLNRLVQEKLRRDFPQVYRDLPVEENYGQVEATGESLTGEVEQW